MIVDAKLVANSHKSSSPWWIANAKSDWADSKKKWFPLLRPASYRLPKFFFELMLEFFVMYKKLKVGKSFIFIFGFTKAQLVFSKLEVQFFFFEGRTTYVCTTNFTTFPFETLTSFMYGEEKDKLLLRVYFKSSS